MDEIGVGIVGCGNISTIYLTQPAAGAGREGACACADMLPEVAEAQGKKFGVRGDDASMRCSRATTSTSSSTSRSRRRTARCRSRRLRRGQARLLREAAGVDVDLGRKVVAEAERRKPDARLRARHLPRRRRAAGAQAHRRGHGRAHPLRHRLPDVARHGALASGPGILLQAGRRAGARRRRLLHHRAGQPARAGARACARSTSTGFAGAHRHLRGPAQGLPHHGRDADDAAWRCSSSPPARSSPSSRPGTSGSTRIRRSSSTAPKGRCACPIRISTAASWRRATRAATGCGTIRAMPLGRAELAGRSAAPRELPRARRRRHDRRAPERARPITRAAGWRCTCSR